MNQWLIEEALTERLATVEALEAEREAALTEAHRLAQEALDRMGGVV